MSEASWRLAGASVLCESASGETLLHARDVSRWFGATCALRNVSLAVRSGEIHALAGANGSGKSTLVKLLSGVDRPDLGDIVTIDDASDELDAAGRLGIGTVHQELGLFVNGTVAENLFALQRGRFLSSKRENELAREVLRQVGATFPADTKVIDLPIEEQALVAVALGALVTTRGVRQSVLVIDEVTSILRGDSARRFVGALRQLRDAGTGIVFVSHDLDEILELADRVTVLRDGRVQAVLRTDEVDRGGLIELMTGGVAVPSRTPATTFSSAKKTVLHLEHLHGSLVADVGFDVCEGEIVGLTGLPGSGYDEVPYLIVGSAGPRSGRVVLGNCPILTPVQFSRAGGRIIPGDRHEMAIAASGSVLENFMLDHRGGWSRFGISRVRHERRVVARAVDAYGVKCASIDAPIGSLSGGNQQKLLLGRCMEACPHLLVVHEPTQGVDVHARIELLSLMRVAVRERHMGVLYVCGDLDEVWENTDRVLVMRRGAVTGEFLPERDEPVFADECLY